MRSNKEKKKMRKRSSRTSESSASTYDDNDGSTTSTKTSSTITATTASSSLKDREKSKRKNRKHQQQEPIVYKAKYPSDLSSIQTPSSLYYTTSKASSLNINTSQEPTDGIYENMESINQSKRTLSSSVTSKDTVYDTNDDERRERRRRRRYGTNKPSLFKMETLYLGTMARKEAEKHVQEDTHFRLYHRIPSKAATNIDYLRDHISLYIVFKDKEGHHYHYPIRESSNGTNRSVSVTTTQENFC